MKPKAIYAGSFDPITLGHMDIITRACTLFDLSVGVANNPKKQHFFNINERVVLVARSIAEIGLDVPVHSVTGLLAEHCVAEGIRVIVRGLRNTIDFEYEYGMARINHGIGRVETVFLPGKGSQSHISSSAVRELAMHGAEVVDYVPAAVSKAIKAKVKT
jgi:pantetheine-phosphate adenylyltransferase